MRATDVGHALHDESPSIDVRRMPGEFERQQTLLVGGSSLVYAAPNVFADIARGVRGRLTLVALVNDDFDRHICAEALAKREVARDAARFVRLRHDSMWVRDFGPISVLDTQGRSWLVDSLYNELGRTHDEVVPNVLAQMAVAPMFRSNLNVDGGNVLSNGAGILLTTNAIVEDNPGHTQQSLGKLLGKYFGGRYVVFLEPLANESTGHVDMFATFTSPDTVVVGSYDPEYDRVNAAILDRNAAILARLQTSNGPMQVVRIPMPAHDEEIWRTYTNVVYANGVLMIPAYANSPAPLEDQVIGSYQSLLPHWHILTINVDNVIRSGGALHCLTMNMSALRSSELDEAHTLPPLLEEFPSDDLSRQAPVAQ
jgi:agmatine/peptidylarginine deiminase